MIVICILTLGVSSHFSGRQGRFYRSSELQTMEKKTTKETRQYVCSNIHTSEHLQPFQIIRQLCVTDKYLSLFYYKIKYFYCQFSAFTSASVILLCNARSYLLVLFCVQTHTTLTWFSKVCFACCHIHEKNTKCMFVHVCALTVQFKT